MNREILGGCPCTEIDGFLVEGPLVPAYEAEVIGGLKEEGVFLGPFEYV
jgi:hypothetical protein